MVWGIYIDFISCLNIPIIASMFIWLWNLGTFFDFLGFFIFILFFSWCWLSGNLFCTFYFLEIHGGEACTEWLQPAGEGKGAPCLSWGLGRGPDVPHMSEVCKQLLDVLSSLTPLLWPREPWLSLGHKERDSGFNAQAFMHWQMSKPAELYEEQKQVSVRPTQSRFQSETVLFLMSFVEFWNKTKRKHFKSVADADSASGCSTSHSGPATLTQTWHAPQQHPLYPLWLLSSGSPYL